MQSLDQAVLRAIDCQRQRLPPDHGGVREKAADPAEHIGQRKTCLETFTGLKNDTVTQLSPNTKEQRQTELRHFFVLCWPVRGSGKWVEGVRGRREKNLGA
jgi:hypothetical protein